MQFKLTSSGAGPGDCKIYHDSKDLLGEGELVTKDNPWVDEPHTDGWVQIELSDNSTIWLYDAHWPTVYSQKHGWLEMDVTGLPGIYLYNYNDNGGWVFTAEGMYPFVYFLESGEWGWFDQDSSLGQRMFYIYTGGVGWMKVPSDG